MSRSVAERLRDARSFAHNGEIRILGLDQDVFRQTVEVKYTVYYCLIGIGEALQGVPADVLSLAPNIPWESVIAMRNRLVHAYWRIDDEIVYDVATIELSALGAALEKLMTQLAQT